MSISHIFRSLRCQRIFAAHGLRIFDVDRLSTHGGSLRIYAAHEESQRWEEQPSVAKLLAEERRAGLDDISQLLEFFEQVNKTKFELLRFLGRAKRAGKKIVGYGAPAKGNTLLNFCGIRSDFLDFTVDKSPQKQGMFLPGTRISYCGTGEDIRDKTGLCADLALEFARRDCSANVWHCCVGRQVRGTNSSREGS